MKIKKGDIVSRKSYNNDIFFIVDRIIKTRNNTDIAILKGITIRIEADAFINDLIKVDIGKVRKSIEKTEERFNKRLESFGRLNRDTRGTYGKILHLDGDRKYSEKSVLYYRKMGLDATVRNVAENRQPQIIRELLEKYKPDILVITGHDAMLKNGTNYNNIYNYRNSRHFVNSVIQARKWQYSSEKLFIFAGACQSYFEAIMSAGADFASSPGRILIDFIDPIIIAEKVATTDRNVFIRPYEIIKEIKEGEKGVNGIGAKGKKRLA